MSVHWFVPQVSLTALLDPFFPPSLVTWLRTCAYVDSDLSLPLPLVFQTPCPACSYFPILPRPWCPGILLTSSDLNSSVCLVSDSLLPLLSLLCRILDCPCKHFFAVLCTLLFPLPFCCLPGSLFCSCPSCRMSQPGGVCWRSRLCTIKLLVVFHSIEVSLAFLGRCGCFPTEQQFLAVSMLLTTSALQDKLKSCTLWSQKEGLCIEPVVECGSCSFSCVGSWVLSVEYLVYLIWVEKT